jgi:hypothetical protein
MSQLSNHHQSHRSKILPHSTISPQEIAQRKATRDELGARCREIFERIRPELLEQHYNWFIAIEPDSENYLIDPTLSGLLQKVRHQYASSGVKLTTFRLNETGACGKI